MTEEEKMKKKSKEKEENKKKDDELKGPIKVFNVRKKKKKWVSW